jgi:hypothetical protein
VDAGKGDAGKDAGKANGGKGDATGPSRPRPKQKAKPNGRPKPNANRRQRRRRRTSASKSFWTGGGPARSDGPAPRIRPTTDPSAVPRSLGTPPLSPETAPDQRLAIVYEEAVRAATALAAAGGILDQPTDAEDPDAS